MESKHKLVGRKLVISAFILVIIIGLSSSSLAQAQYDLENIIYPNGTLQNETLDIFLPLVQ